MENDPNMAVVWSPPTVPENQPLTRLASANSRIGPPPPRAADGAALQTEHQEMPLEMPGDEAVFGADKMQHLDDDLVGRHRPARRECNGEHRGREHQGQYADAGADGRGGHGAHPLDPAAM